MSDLQDLIHRNAKLAYDQGASRERERILQQINNLINAVVDYTLTPIQYDQATQRMTEIIKGEQK